MKKTFSSLNIEISDWTPKLKMVAIVFAIVTILSSIMTLLLKVTVPGLTPIAFGSTMLLLGIREFNLYFGQRKNVWMLVLAIITTLIFVFHLYIGTNQIITAIAKYVGL